MTIRLLFLLALAAALHAAPAVERAHLARGLQPVLLNTRWGTVVASAEVEADTTGRKDATAALQQAVDRVAAAEGGVVYLPAGRYRLDGSLKLGYGVTLLGDWRPPDEGGLNGGTLLLAYGGRGRDSGPPLIEAPPGAEASVIGLSIGWPEQRPGEIQPYPAAVGGGSLTLRDVTFLNAYTAVELAAVNASVIEGLYGTVLRRGLVLPHSTEFSWLHDVHFDPGLWRAASRRLGAPLDRAGAAAVEDYVRDHLVGLELGRLDGLVIHGYDCPGAKLPVLIRKNAEQNPHPVFGFGGVVADCHGAREEAGWDPWYYGLHYADLDRVPEAAARHYTFARVPSPAKTGGGSLFDVTQPPFGAAGDGVADDTAAIEAALQAAAARGGGTVYLRQGEYRVTRPLTIPRGVELRGPLGRGKIREYRETCALAVECGAGSAHPESDPAFLTLEDHAGVRGLEIVYPDQPLDAAGLREYPFTIRGDGAGVWLADLMLVNAVYGIDLASRRCDGHVVVGVWATALRTGITVGGGSRGGRLERLAFSHGPWSEAGRFAAVRSEAAVKGIADYRQTHCTDFTFGDCSGERAWGLVGFLPNRHFHFRRDRGRGCMDAEFWMTMHDVGREVDVQADAGEDIHLLGYFGTGSGGGVHNWLEVGDGFRGPLHVYAKTIQQPFWNHPLTWRPEQVHLHDEVSLTTGRPAVASATQPDSRAAWAVDRNVRTLWEAPAGSTLTVDLGGEFTVDRFGLENAGLVRAGRVNTLRAELRVSLDGEQFEPAAVLNPNGFAWADMPVDPVSARFVRLVVTDAGSADGLIRVATFSVGGRPAAD
ncbi:MAG: discoidin domain-containing protein [Armatimonadetes bacterium]|nr:discoidin domain-containing protein [Armatimonadota bacterium]